MPILQVAFTLVTTPLILQSLGKNDYGIWFLLQSIVLWFGMARFGFDTTLMRNLAAIRDQPVGDETKTLVSSTFFASALILVILGISSLFVSPLFGSWFDVSAEKESLLKLTFVIIFIIFAFNFLGNSLESLFYARDMFYKRNIVCAIRNVLQFTLVIIVYALNKLNLIGLALIFMVTAFFEFTALLLYSRRIWGFFPALKNFDFNVIKRMFQPSIGYFIISIAALVIFRTDNFIVAGFLSIEAVAVYAIAFYLLDYTMKFIWSFSEMLSPRFSACYYNNQYDELRSIFWKMNCVTVGLALIGGLGIYFFGFWFLQLWIGEANVVDRQVLNVFACTLFFQSIAHACGVFINAIGKHKPVIWFSSLEAVLNVGISIALVQNYGMLGVALGTLIAHLLTTGWFIPYFSFKIIRQPSMNPMPESKPA